MSGVYTRYYFCEGFSLTSARLFLEAFLEVFKFLDCNLSSGQPKTSDINRVSSSNSRFSWTVVHIEEVADSYYDQYPEPHTPTHSH